MNLEDARKILQLTEEEFPDSEAEEAIEIATMFKDIFFDMLKKGELNSNN